jgi:alpha-beta hydrolase superfamily lysophospholipase
MVATTEFHFTSGDGLRIACVRWDSRTPVRAVVQIAHGMGEHVGRYAHTADVLSSEGFAVYGNDHRGHGHSAPSAAHLGDFGAGGFPLLVDDMVQLSRIAREEHPGQPLVLLGYGMGSLAAQLYALDHSDEIDALILSGSGALDGLAKVAHSASSGKSILDSCFERALSSFEWLNRNLAIVDASIAEPPCFAELQPAAFASFLAAADRLSDLAILCRIRRDLPVYLFSGSEDSVGEQLEGVRTVIDRYGQAGIRDVAHDFYLGGRHEMLNELNRDEVLAQLVDWIDATLSREESSQRSRRL